VLKEFWATSPTSYKVLVMTAIGLLAVGLILNIAGNTSENPGMVTASLPVIGLGLVLHLVGVGYRSREIRKGYKR
jgi:fucose permease